MSDHVSHSLLGKYEIRGTLGKGAMGTVYDGRDPIIDRRVAIKTVNLPEGHDEEAEEGLARFKREAQAAGRLQHPNIVGVFDYGETADVAFIVMEFVEGRTLKQLLDTGDRLPLHEVVRLMQDILAGLSYSHASGVVHRDIKPANIMLTQDRRAKIADFGIARIESSSMTQAGTVLGTPAYMSPEQFMGQVVDRRTDIYSSGVLLYQLLTGERPFEGGLTAIMHKALNTVPARPSELSVTAPMALDAVVMRAMAKRPEDRFGDADEFARALTQALQAPAPDDADGEATIVTSAPRIATATAAAPKPPASAGKPSGSKLPLIAAGVLGLAVVGGGGAYFALSGKPSAPPETIVASVSPASPQAAVTGPAAAPVATSPVAASPPSQSLAAATPPPATPRAAPVQPTPVPPAPVQQLAVAQPAAPPATSQASPPPATPVQPASPIRSPAPIPAPAAALPVVQPAPATPAPQPVPEPQPVAPPQQQAMLQPQTPPPASSPPVSPPPPAAPPKTAAALRGVLAASLPGIGCTFTDVAVSPAMAATVRGIAGRGAPDDALRQAVSAADPAATDWRVADFDGPYCPALDTLRAVPGRLAMARADDRPALKDNEVINVAVTMPAFAGYLHMAYLANDGTVSPLVPGAGFPARTYPAGARQDFGQPRTGFEGWKVGPPFGTDMIVAIASTTPLFAAALPDSEPLDAYLRDLQAALDAVRKRGGNLAANAIVLATQPAK